jgi:hypothetical protein
MPRTSDILHILYVCVCVCVCEHSHAAQYSTLAALAPQFRQLTLQHSNSFRNVTFFRISGLQTFLILPQLSRDRVATSKSPTPVL